LVVPPPPRSPLFPYTTLFRSRGEGEPSIIKGMIDWVEAHYSVDRRRVYVAGVSSGGYMTSILLSCYGDLFAAGMVGGCWSCSRRSEEHTSELQSLRHLVCRLL